MIHWKKMLIYAITGLHMVCAVTGCSSGLSSNEQKSETGAKTDRNEESDTSETKDADQNQTAQRDIFAMDTYMTLKAYGEQAEEALDAAVEEINRLDDLFSTGNEDSEVSLVNTSGSIYLSEEMSELIEKAKNLYQDTNGAFDITIYPLMEAWGFTDQNYHVPDEACIQNLLNLVDASLMEYDKETGFLSLPDGVEIDLGGIAKGYTSNRVMEIFEEYELSAGIISLGGNVQAYRRKTDGTPWRVAVENPDESEDYIGILEIEDQAVITSGGYERYFEEDGTTYHHILDPSTGYPAESGLTSVTIVSSDGTLADGLSTSLFIMGKEKALSYWRSHRDDFDVILVEEDGSITITEGLKDTFTSEFDYVIAQAEE